MKTVKLSKQSSQCLKVLLIDPMIAQTSPLRRALIENNYEIVEQTTESTRIYEHVIRNSPDVIMISMNTPDQNTLKELSKLKEQHPLPVIVFAEKDNPNMIQQVIKAGVNAFIVDDIQIQRLPSIVNIAIARFNEQKTIEQELSSVKNKLADRKILERAKGLLMAQKNMSEEQAYNSIRKMAMDKGQPMTSIAENLIDAFKLLNE